MLPAWLFAVTTPPGPDTRYRTPRTTLPFAPVGVMVTCTLPVAPGWTITGVVCGAEAFTAAAKGSPVLEVSAASNAWVCAVAVIVELPAGAPVVGNGPICWT